MAPFYDYAIPLFLVVFLIICITVYIWIKNKNNNIQEHIKYKPIHSNSLKTSETSRQLTPTIERLYDGFTSGSGSGSGSAPRSAPACGSGSGSLPPCRSKKPSQFDLPAYEQVNYGKWEKTPVDSYYDYYELAEEYAAYERYSQLKTISPPPIVPSIVGSTLGSFDSETTQIPWDKDNESYNITDVVWGYVSEEASKSIFLKTYINEVASRADAFQACGEESTNFCYRSPLFEITTTDQKVATALQVGEQTSVAIGQIPLMFLSEVDFNLENIGEVFAKRQEAVQDALHAIGRKASHAMEYINTQSVKAGHALYSVVGSRKIIESAKYLLERTRNAMLDVLQNLNVKFKTNSMIMGITINAAALAAAGGAYLTGGALAPVAAALGALAVAFDLFFGVFGGLMMAVEALLAPLVNSLFNSGGVCPPGSKPITELLPSSLIAFLGDMIPAGSFLQTFNPFICWTPEGTARLKIPPRVSPLMSDRTLSIIYHSKWITGNSPGLPSPTTIKLVPDPLPQGYVWLNDSDLANSPDLNEITKMASSIVKSGSYKGSFNGSGSGSYKGSFNGSGSGSASGSRSGSASASGSANIAVKMCQPGTISSSDGMKCVQERRQIKSTTPTMTPCGASEFDDGYNCWNAQRSANCSGGDVRYTSSTIWNDETGYLSVYVNPLVCTDGQTSGSAAYIVKPYKERLVCNDGYEIIRGRELLCYQPCPASFTRDGSICVSSVSTYDREYMLGTFKTIETQPNYDYNNLMNTVNDIPIDYCDFSSPEMLNRMANFYYKNSLANPKIIYEDNTVEVQIITGFFGVIASSELSCDVVCNINFITYDPITGGKYSLRTGCSYEGAFEGCSYCFRRFYFIKTPTDKKGEFTVTGCTYVDYTAIEAMVKSSDPNVNLVPSLPKKFVVLPKDGSKGIIDVQNFLRELASGNIGKEASVGLIEAGIAIVGGMLGGLGGGFIGKSVAGNALAKAAEVATLKEIGKIGTKMSTQTIQTTMTTAVAATKQGDDAVRAAFKAGGFADTEADTLTLTLMKGTQMTAAEMGGNVFGGVGGGLGAGLFTSMYLDKILRKALGTAVPPNDVLGTVNTFITGTSIDNLSIASSSHWWSINHGSIYELANPGYIPDINFCENVKVTAAYCTHKYIIRNMINKYHNKYQTTHVKEVVSIEPRGTSGCYYKFNEVSYNPQNNEEGTVKIEREVMLTNTLSDYATCTYTPNDVTQTFDNTTYPVRSYVDSSTKALATPKIIYPTRNTVYTSDIFARYVRIRPPLQDGTSSGTSGGSGSDQGVRDGILSIQQICVFDVSGMNISRQMPTKAVGTASSYSSPDSVVDGFSSISDDINAAWQCITGFSQTEYWEVDLSNNKNISQVIYFGGTFPEARKRHRGVRIEFLYDNDSNSTPIFTHVLNSDEPQQTINLYSSFYSTPMYPISGPIKIPRPLLPGITIGGDNGCTKRCEDRSVIDSLVKQYNDRYNNHSIIKILRGTTPTSNSCEYEAEIITKDLEGGSETVEKKSISTKSILMNITTNTSRNNDTVRARFIRIIPSFTPGTVLEFSKILVRAIDRSEPNNLKYLNVSANKPVVTFNMYYELEELRNESNNSRMPFLTTPTPGVATEVPTVYPNIFRASDNDAETFFQIDLLPPNPGRSGGSDGSGGSGGSSKSTLGANYEIYDITFVGRGDRQPGGIRGIQIQLFKDVPGDQENCCNSTKYDPVYRYFLPDDTINQIIRVYPPSLCTFNLVNATILENPKFLQENSAAFKETDTSGGVFSYSSIVETAKNAWKSVSQTSAQATLGVYNSEINSVQNKVRNILDTMQGPGGKTLLDSDKECKDSYILNRIMGAYNVKKGADPNKEFSVILNKMTRILKSGQSSPSTCDVLFENIEENYDDYIEDIGDKDMIVNSVKAARFTISKYNDSSYKVDKDSIVDIKSDALGLKTDVSILSPVYSAKTTCAVDCADPNRYKPVAARILDTVKDTPRYTRTSKIVKILNTFQTSPLSCEYELSTRSRIKSKVTQRTIEQDDLNSIYVKALFEFDSDGCTPILKKVDQYNQENITFSSDYKKAYINGKEVTLPTLYGYNPTKKSSRRVDSVIKNI